MTMQNNNPGDFTLLPGVDTEGEEILSVLIKRSYTFYDGRIASRCEKDNSLLSGDVYFDGEKSSVKYENDYVPVKNKTDVVVNAKAYAPAGRPQYTLCASVKIDTIKKTLLVYGNRRATKHSFGQIKFSDPEPFIEMDIKYENGYGGTAAVSGSPFSYAYPRNPLGKGFIIDHKNIEPDGCPLPNIENPDDVLTPQNICVKMFENWRYQPAPQGFGWYHKLWYPRVSYAGLLPNYQKYEKELRRRYYTYVPEDHRDDYAGTNIPQMNFAYFNGASPGLQLPFLRCDEVITLENLLKEHSTVTFALPGEKPFIRFDAGFGVNDIQPQLHTVMIEVENRTVDLVWRGAVKYPGIQWLPDMKENSLVIE